MTEECAISNVGESTANTRTFPRPTLEVGNEIAQNES